MVWLFSGLSQDRCMYLASDRLAGLSTQMLYLISVHPVLHHFMSIRTMNPICKIIFEKCLVISCEFSLPLSSLSVAVKIPNRHSRWLGQCPYLMLITLDFRFTESKDCFKLEIFTALIKTEFSIINKRK